MMSSFFKQIANSRAIRAVGVLLVSDGVSSIVGMAISVVLAQKLGDTLLSLVFLTIALVETIAQFLDIRPEEGVIRFASQALVQDERIRAANFFYVGITLDVVLMLLTMLIVSLAAPVASAFYPESETTRSLINIYLLTIPFTTLRGTFSALLQIYKRFHLIAIVSMIERTILLFYILSAGSDAADVMWGYVISAFVAFSLITLIGVWLLVTRLKAWRVQGYGKCLREFLPFVFHTSLTTSLKAILANIDVLILGMLRPINEVSYYKLGRSAAGLIVVPNSPLRTVLYPELNEAWAHRDADRVRSLIGKFMVVNLVSGVGLYLVMVLMADLFVSIFYPPAFAPTSNVIRILGLGLVAQSLVSWVRLATLADNQPQLATSYSMVNSIAYIPLLILFIAALGLNGAAWASNALVAVTILLFVLYVIPKLSISPIFKQT